MRRCLPWHPCRKCRKSQPAVNSKRAFVVFFYKMEEKKGLRINGTFRWSGGQTRDLLTNIVDTIKDDPDRFEKPTAQKFYHKIAENVPNLRHIKWEIMRTKLRHLKANFLSAVNWKAQADADDPTSVAEHIKIICPFYEYLHKIFGRRINVQQPVIDQSTESLSSFDNVYPELSIEIEPDASSNPLASPPVKLTSLSPLASPSANFASDTSTCTPKRALKRPHNSSDSVSLLFEIQKKKLELETKKLEFEKEKQKNYFQLQKLKLEKEERVEMEKIHQTTTKRTSKRAHNNSNQLSLLVEIQKQNLELETKKLEFEKEKEENNLHLQKLRLEKEERVEMEKIRLEHDRLSSLKSSQVVKML